MNYKVLNEKTQLHVETIICELCHDTVPYYSDDNLISIVKEAFRHLEKRVLGYSHGEKFEPILQEMHTCIQQIEIAAEIENVERKRSKLD